MDRLDGDEEVELGDLGCFSGSSSDEVVEVGSLASYSGRRSLLGSEYLDGREPVSHPALPCSQSIPFEAP